MVVELVTHKLKMRQDGIADMTHTLGWPAGIRF